MIIFVALNDTGMEVKTFKRLPYGNSNFERLISDNYAYVDKTQFIEMLEREENPYQFFIRPRKFGKSLFLTMLSHYYDLLRGDNFSKLFGGLYIGENPTPRKNSYAIMEFDFSGINTTTPENFRKSFELCVQSTICAFLERYQSVLPNAMELSDRILSNNHGIGSLQEVFNVAKIANVKLFITIDEYDHFANDLIDMEVDDIHKKWMMVNGVIRNFYAMLKMGTSKVVDRVFITGISPTLIDDLTNGFNIAQNITLEARYNNMMGFTEQEVEQLMNTSGIDRKLINVDMKWYYNGYLFNKDATDRVYNPSMMLYFLNQILSEEKVPEKIIDDNLKTYYNHLQRLTWNDTNSEMLLQIVKDGGIMTEVHTKFSMDNLYNDEYFASLLFYMGLLTIEKRIFGKVWLCIPNYSIKTVFWDFVMEMAQ